MDARLVLAVAGSGKTSHLVAAIGPTERSLVLTYTESNYRTLHEKIAARYGCIPNHVHLSTYFSFLYSFCLRPYLADEMGLRGINWNQPPRARRGVNKASAHYYVDQNRRLYSSRMADLLASRGLIDDVKARVSRYFDRVCIDEVQDFAGYDFNLLCDLITCGASVLLVGDFYQHTYDTSRDGTVNATLHDDVASYKGRFEELGCLVDETTLSRSYRCSPTVCGFVSQSLGVGIESHRTEDTLVEFVDTQERAVDLFQRTDVVKLFYQEHYRYPCLANNWGAAKGIDSYEDVCVVLNKKTTACFEKGTLSSLPASTRNKLYVACTRAAANLYLVPDEFYREYKST